MKVTLTTATETTVLARHSGDERRAIWFENRNTTDPIYLRPRYSSSGSDVDADEFILPPAASATDPSRLIIQRNSADEFLVNAEWRALQASGGDLDLHYGTW